MKRLFALLGVVLLMCSLVLVSCAKKETKDSDASIPEETTDSDASTPEEAKDSEVVKPSETKDGDEKIVIAGVYKFGTATWFINEGKAAGDKVKELGADEWLYVDAGTDGSQFLEMIDTVIARKVSGVICCPPDQTLSQAAVDKFNEAGIPVIAADDALIDDNGDKLTKWVGIDAYAIGKESALWAIDYMKEHGLDKDEECGVMIMTTNTVTSCIPRTEGQLDAFKEVLPEFPNERIFQTDYVMDLGKAYDAANGVIVANPQIKKWIVVSTADEGTVGATRALEQAGLDKESCTIGLGGYLAPGEFEKNSCFKAAAYFSAFEVGEASATHIMKMIKGEEVPDEYAVSCIMVTPENYIEAMPEYLE
ncbi:MAG TPA: substrate-binding domain-containing protein [Clostridiaceae bacterium]|nr:substrate-binding domain-containing protein [Clostridiaceae bacterium]